VDRDYAVWRSPDDFDRTGREEVRVAEKQHDHPDREHDRPGDQQRRRSPQGGAAQPASSGPAQRLSAEDTRRYFDDYLRYRFGKAGSPEDFAKEAGVSADVVKGLLAQKQGSDADLAKVADAINVSHGLAEEIFGFRPMPEVMRHTLDRFFEAQMKAGAGPAGSSHGREDHEHQRKGAHAT
jgi:hypothetical protein